jgi:hypothetical protein
MKNIGFYENTPLKTLIINVENMLDLDQVIILEKDVRNKMVRKKKRKLEELLKNESEEKIYPQSKKRKLISNNPANQLMNK